MTAMKFCAAPATRRRDLVRKVRSGVNEATFADAYGSDCIAPLQTFAGPQSVDYSTRNRHHDLSGSPARHCCRLDPAIGVLDPTIKKGTWPKRGREARAMMR